MFKLGSKSKKEESKNTGTGRGPARDQEKIAKRILGKDTGRHTFGFPCTSSLHADIKMRAGELQVPIFALAEHCLELGIDTIEDVEDSEERDLLRKHLIEHHINRRTIEKFNWYDEELAKDMNEERLRRFEIERTVRLLVADFVRKGMDPRYMAFYLEHGYRCFYAQVRGWPVPKPQTGMFKNRPRPTANQPTDEKGNRTDGNSSEHSE